MKIISPVLYRLNWR